MKKLLLVLSLYPCLLLADEVSSPFMAKEWNIDVFGSSEHPVAGGHFFENSRGGLGVGGSYYITRNLGFGMSAESQDAHRVFVDSSQVNLYGRLPFGKTAFAGYVLTGFGYQYEDRDWFVHQGVGVEYRFHRYAGVFVQGSYESGIDTADRAVLKAGVRAFFR